MNNSGMRISEVINLKVKDVEFRKGWQYGRTYLKKRKRKGESHTFIDREFLPNLYEYKEKYLLKGNDFWFTSSKKDENGKHKQYTQGKSINNSIKLYLRKIGLGDKADNISNHSFRHMFLTRIGKKYNIQIAQLWAGHKSIKTTEKYFHCSLDE